MTKSLTRKQAKFVKGIAEGKLPTVSAQDSYDVKNYATAAVIASENLNKPNVKEAIDAEMARQGLTMEKIIAPVAKALEKKNVLGEDDLEIQLKGHDRAVKLMSFGQKKDEGGNTFNFTQINNDMKGRYD